MYLLSVSIVRRLRLFIAVGACLAMVAACGGGDEVETIASAADAEVVEDQAGEQDHTDDEDHDDHEDHEDDDHGDEDHDDHDHEGSGTFDAHVHGAADLFVAWSGGEVRVDLISPANNIFGFEYEPTTEEDRRIAAEQTAILSAPGVLVPNAEAECTLEGDVEPVFDVDGSHAEVATSWVFMCDNPDELKQLDATVLFEKFPGILDLDAQWSADSGQSAAELSPTSTVLRFE